MNTTEFMISFPTVSQVEAIIAGFDKQDAEAYKNMDYRMQNYYNCVDDYSYGGICDKVAQEGISNRRYKKDILTTQITTGKPISDVNITHVLCDINTGEIVSERIVKGAFGYCWIIGGKNGAPVSFVGIYRKPSTYASKGYMVKTVKTYYEYYFDVRLFIHSRVTKVEMTNEFDGNPTTYVPKTLYFATQK